MVKNKARLIGFPPARLRVLGLMVAAAVVMGGCSRLANSLGVSKSAPDEFAVVTKAPLVVPPDFNLRPPDPTRTYAEDVNPRNVAFKALFPDGSTLPMPSRGELALLRASGAGDVDPDVRHSLGANDLPAVLKGVFTREILYGLVGNQDQAPTISRRTPTPLSGS